MRARALRTLGIPVLAVLGVLAFGVALAILCMFMLWQEDRQFDSGLEKVEQGMSKAEVVQIMGKPHHVFSSEGVLDAHQRSLREWFAEFDRPIRASNTVLEFTGYERQAYVYLDSEERVEAVVIARRGRDDGFKLMTLGVNLDEP